MKNNKGIAAILIVLIIVVVLALGEGIYYFWSKKTQKPVACTQEAKICPDGSVVSRTGPNCEFAECPTVKPGEIANWKTYRSEEYKFEVKYPSDWIYLKNEGASAGLFNIKAPAATSNPHDTINANIFPREGSESNQEYIDNLINKTTLPGYMDLLSKKKVIFNNLKGYELIWKITDLETNKTYEGPIDVFFETPSGNKNRFIALIFSGEATEDNPNLLVFRSILATFRFFE
jgi:hypothetical protein